MTIAAANILTTLNGLYKEVYPDGISNAVPSVAVLSKEIKFSEKQKVGNYYHQPVILSQEHGATYLASGAGVTALNAAVAAIMKDAQIQGTQLIMRSQMDYEAAARAASSKASFMDASEVMVKNLMESAHTRKEVMTFYGGTNLGVISASSVSTNATLTLTTASFASGIWNSAVNCPLDAYNGASKVNSNAAFYVVSVNPSAHQIVVSGNSSDLSALAQNHVLKYRGAHGAEFLGLDSIIGTSGTLFNIDNSVYNLWASQSYACGSASLTLAKIQSAIALAVGKGLNESVKCYVNPLTFANLITNESALRKYDSSYSSAQMVNGAESIKFYSLNGVIEVIPHIVVKEGEGFIVPVKRLSYIGATDVSLTVPGTNNEQVFLHIPDYNAFEIRSYMNLALFTDKPGWIVKLTGIVNG